MKICIFGAGAVGGHVAAKLAAGGHDVSVIARGAHLEAMRDKGITLIHGDKTIRGRVRARAGCIGLGLQDFVFVTLKANALGDFAEAAAPLLGAADRRGVRPERHSVVVRHRSIAASARGRPIFRSLTRAADCKNF